VNSKPHIFLDIDGVLSLDFDEVTYSNQKKWFEKMIARCPLNKKAVKAFNTICETTDPVIILSEFFEWNGITHKITAYTPSAWGVMFTSFQQLEECRAYEINLYVHERELINWVAIDDLDLSPWIPNNFVHTPKSNEGIKQSGVKDKILNILLN